MSSVAEKPSSDVQNRILDATETLVQTKGVGGLTLEAAAKLAGVSKGGLLYHFSSKEALLDAALKRLSEYFRTEFETCVAAQPEGPGRVARAMIAWAWGEDETACDERDERAAGVYLAAFHHDPSLLDPIRAVYGRLREAVLADGLPPGAGAAIMCAGDGAFMSRIFQLYGMTAEERRTIAAALARLLDPLP